MSLQPLSAQLPPALVIYKKQQIPQHFISKYMAFDKNKNANNVPARANASRRLPCNILQQQNTCRLIFSGIYFMLILLIIAVIPTEKENFYLSGWTH